MPARMHPRRLCKPLGSSASDQAQWWQRGPMDLVPQIRLSGGGTQLLEPTFSYLRGCTLQATRPHGSGSSDQAQWWWYTTFSANILIFVWVHLTGNAGPVDLVPQIRLSGGTPAQSPLPCAAAAEMQREGRESTSCSCDT
eukprot:1160937-Pelagomonas_calceolata.AAC.2